MFSCVLESLPTRASKHMEPSGRLILPACGITSFTGLKELERTACVSTLNGGAGGLTYIAMPGNRLWCFDHFGTHNYLRELHLQDNDLASFMGLTRQPGLEVLNLRGNPIAAHPHYRIMALLTVGRSIKVIDGLRVEAAERDMLKRLGPTCALAVSYGWLLDLTPRSTEEYNAIIARARHRRKVLVREHRARCPDDVTVLTALDLDGAAGGEKMAVEVDDAMDAPGRGGSRETSPLRSEVRRRPSPRGDMFRHDSTMSMAADSSGGGSFLSGQLQDRALAYLAQKVLTLERQLDEAEKALRRERAAFSSASSRHALRGPEVARRGRSADRNSSGGFGNAATRRVDPMLLESTISGSRLVSIIASETDEITLGHIFAMVATNVAMDEGRRQQHMSRPLQCLFKLNRATLSMVRVFDRSVMLQRGQRQLTDIRLALAPSDALAPRGAAAAPLVLTLCFDDGGWVSVVPVGHQVGGDDDAHGEASVADTEEGDASMKQRPVKALLALLGSFSGVASAHRLLADLAKPPTQLIPEAAKTSATAPPTGGELPSKTSAVGALVRPSDGGTSNKANLVADAPPPTRAPLVTQSSPAAAPPVPSSPPSSVKSVPSIADQPLLDSKAARQLDNADGSAPPPRKAPPAVAAVKESPPPLRPSAPAAPVAQDVETVALPPVSTSTTDHSPGPTTPDAAPIPLVTAAVPNGMEADATASRRSVEVPPKLETGPSSGVVEKPQIGRDGRAPNAPEQTVQAPTTARREELPIAAATKRPSDAGTGPANATAPPPAASSSPAAASSATSTPFQPASPPPPAAATETTFAARRLPQRKKFEFAIEDSDDEGDSKKGPPPPVPAASPGTSTSSLSSNAAKKPASPQQFVPSMRSAAQAPPPGSSPRAAPPGSSPRAPTTSPRGPAGSSDPRVATPQAPPQAATAVSGSSASSSVSSLPTQWRGKNLGSAALRDSDSDEG